MPQRQQRSPNFRGRVQTINEYPRNSISTQLEVVDPTLVQLTPSLDVGALIIRAILPLEETVSMQMPLMVTYTMGKINVFYSSPIGPDCHFVLPAGCPAVRTKEGLYLSPIDITSNDVPWPNTPIARFEYSATADGTNIVPVTVLGVTLAECAPFICWSVNGGAYDGEPSKVNGSLFNITFPGNIGPLAVIRYKPGLACVMSDDGKLPHTEPYVIPA